MQTLVFVRKCILFLFLIFLHGFCNSQAYKYRFRIIDLPENFKNQYISLVDEDAAGMFWFVTNSGLHRYDGNQVLSFDVQSTPALPDADIQQLLADSRNHVWVVIGKKLICFDLKKWSTRVVPFQHNSPSFQNNGITALAEGKDSTVYVGCGDDLYRIFRDSLEFITHIDRQPGSLSYFTINGISEPVAGRLLLNTSNGRIVSVKHQQRAFSQPVYVKLEQLTNASAPSSFRNVSSKYLMNPIGGPYVVDIRRGVASLLDNLIKNPFLKNLNHYEIHTTELGNSNAIFYYKNRKAGETGLLVYNPEQNTLEDLSEIYPAALKNNKLRSMGYKNGHILIPIKGGIATISYTNNAFDVFAASLENANSIRSIYKQPGGSLFLGSYLHDFVQFDENANAMSRLPGSLVSCILPWQKDTLLAGTEGGGIGWYLPASHRFININNFEKNTFINPYINCFTRETDTSVWVGTNTGFYLLNPRTHRILKSSTLEKGQPLLQSMVYVILKVGSSYFFATREGLFKYNVSAKSWVKLLTATGNNYGNSFFSCLQLVNNQVWAGTVGNGILVLDTAGNLMRKITTAEGLASNIIFSNPVCKNHLFVGTRNGLSIIDLQTNKINNYSSEFYLPADEFNRSAWSVNGDTVYMGTINGFVRIDVNRLRQQRTTIATDVCFSSFTFSNGSTSQSDYTLPYRKNLSFTIPPEVSNFSIGLGGLSEMANGLKLYYRLNADGSWQSIGQRREITFVNTAPDNYTLQIAARLPDGRWMDNMLTLPIHVKPHFYQTGWWKTLLIATALGLIWLGIKYRERTLRKEEQLRNRIAGDLHDEVGSALTRIYFQAGMLTAADGTETVSPTTALQQIATSSQAALSSMSDMVWSIDAHHDNAPDMINRIRDYIARLQDELDCVCIFNVSGSYEHLKLSQVLRQNILLIFKEAMNNAIKYGNNRTVTVDLLLNENIFSLDIVNKLPALGVVETTVQGGHGMKSMRLRADKIKAKLSITRTQDQFAVKLQARPF